MAWIVFRIVLEVPAIIGICVDKPGAVITMIKRDDDEFALPGTLLLLLEGGSVELEHAIGDISDAVTGIVTSVKYKEDGYRQSG